MSRAVTQISEDIAKRRARPARAGLVGVWLKTGLLAVALSACGVRGSLDAPPDAKAEQDKAKAEASKSPGTKAEHKPFILDGLIR